MPVGFDAVSYTAISAEAYWLLGTAPCSSSVCTSIIRTTDGGAHFVGIPAPPAHLSYGAAPHAVDLVDTLRFADPFDGFALGLGPTGGLWVTHDGGEHWRSVTLGDVEAFGVSGGEAYAVGGNCTAAACSDVHLERSAASSNAWTQTPLPAIQGSPRSSVSIRGDQVWIDAETGNGSGDVLLHSADGGKSFTTGASPCRAGLGGTVQATSPSVLWFMCPTGMMASAQRSTDSGVTFERLDTGEIVNSSLVAADDDSSAVLVSGDSPSVRRTTDGGETFHEVFSPPKTTGWLYVGFTTPTIGIGLSTNSTSGPGSVPSTTLWRTTDGGLTWQTVSY